MVGVVISLVRGVSAAQCYHLDGTQADKTHQPCDPDAEVSACCALDKGNPDVCLSSGLCYAQEPFYRGLIYSNGCTDPSGESGECPHFCPDRRDEWNGGAEVEVWNILQCNPGGQFCCRATDDRENCCANSTATVKSDIGSLVLCPTSSTSEKTRSAPSSTDDPTLSHTSTADCPADDTALVGGAVGGALGGALLALVVLTLITWKRKPVIKPFVSQPPQDSRMFRGNSLHRNQPNAQELDGRPVISELRGD